MEKALETTFVSGTHGGTQLGLLGPDVETFVRPKDATKFVVFRADKQLSLMKAAAMTGIDPLVLNKLETGELVATTYWWSKFRMYLNSKLEEEDANPKDS